MKDTPGERGAQAPAAEAPGSGSGRRAVPGA